MATKDLTIQKTALEKAVEELAEHIKAGGELPPGAMANPWCCPVAIYLSEKMGRQVGVLTTMVWVKDSKTRVDLPDIVERWVRNFDQYDWDQEDVDAERR